MIHQSLCSFLILVLLLIVQSKPSFSLDFYYQNCSAPTTCGHHKISYPFFIQGKQEPFCGFPGFNLSCYKDDDEVEFPILQQSGNDYVVHNISYERQSLRLSNALLSNFLDLNGTSCSSNISLVSNLTLPNDQFKLGGNQDEIFLLYKCNSSIVESFSKYEVGCFVPGINQNGVNNTSSVLALPSEEYRKFGDVEVEKCGGEVVVAHVDGGDNGNYRVSEELKRGFALDWLAADCSECRESGGHCGFNYTTHKFRCLCPDRTHTVRCQDNEKGNKLALKLGLGIGIGGAAILAAILFILWRYKRIRLNFLSRNISSQPHTNSDIEGCGVYFGVPVFTYHELEEATDHFNSEKELGDGGFGTVYYGKLKDGREVAVKRLYEHNYKRVEQFENEIEILTRLRHQHLVLLYGCTSRRSRELLLVYEYIPNGTVADHLHGDRAESGSLSWPIRMSIAIETASALSYLHASEIVHRDVKTTNILLDNNFCVKVADFGLSRLFPIDVTHVSTAPQGTPGYVDPEYHQCYQLTSKSDVYSFGVVLIELISSMPAVDLTRHRHEINLANLAINKIQRGLFNELVDPSLGFESDDEVRRKVIVVAELAFQCLQQDNDMRPTMNEVLDALKIIESGNDMPEKLKPAFDEAGMKTSTQPPPSPECDDVGLLKEIRPPFSPISVTQKWPSTRSTPNASV